MDARKSGGNSPQDEIETLGIPPDQSLDIDYQKLRETLHNSTQITLNHLGKLMQGSSKKSNKRLYLELFRALVIDSAQVSESLFFHMLFPTLP